MASKKPSAVELKLGKPQQTLIERAGHPKQTKITHSTQCHLIRPWRCPVWSLMLPRSRFSPCHDNVEPGNHSGR
ncbi:hypothetical protein ASPFODRAFT_54565, partial [Aspergillus luchuensis CBS 106.47]